MFMNNRNDLAAEEICGYQVSSNRKKLWVCELDMIELLESACKQLNIQYFVCFGSAIGAVRHMGFIPWDDDIDIGMLREDFDVFLEKGRSMFPSYIDIQYGLSTHGCDPLLRIRDSRTTGIINTEYKMDGNKGCFIEIYPFDYVNDNWARKIQLKITGQLLLELSYRVKSLNTNSKVKRSKASHIRSCILSPFSSEKLWRFYGKICRLQNNKKSTRYVDTIGLPFYAITGQHLFEKKDVLETYLAEFEYTKIRIAKGYDNILRTRYGDYMQLPPPDQRGTHHDNIVFYDPNTSYKEYENSDVPLRYFEGDNSLELL